MPRALPSPLQLTEAQQDQWTIWDKASIANQVGELPRKRTGTSSV
jgi:hypothetical protein